MKYDMKIFSKNQYLITGAENKPVAVDIQFVKDKIKKPAIIFSHGFKGFKDWGHFNLAAEEFANEGFVFVKYNFSHNGTTPENQTEFTDTDAFGKNNFSKELDDLDAVINFVLTTKSMDDEIDRTKIFLMGHSRGGAITLLKAAEDARIKKAVTWASISDTEKRMNPPELEEWKEKGVAYVENSRTKQQLPLYYQFRENFYENKTRLDLVEAAKRIQIPALIIHGENDQSVLVEEAKQLNAAIKNSELVLIPGADHAFGGRHPWMEKKLPPDALKVIKMSAGFFREAGSF